MSSDETAVTVLFEAVGYKTLSGATVTGKGLLKPVSARAAQPVQGVALRLR